MILICTDLYIPIWLYSNTWLRERNWKAWLLYIPIWLYSNSLKNYQDTFRIIFTFQSGYIQIRIDRIIGLTGTLLHSNLVIFKSVCFPHSFTLQSILHSNLVIFKLRLQLNWLRRWSFYIPIWLYSNLRRKSLLQVSFNFTCQSGYIQMYHVPPFRCHIISFTFQSGYIQIKSLPAVVIIVSIFTFQYGYIQMHGTL